MVSPLSRSSARSPLAFFMERYSVLQRLSFIGVLLLLGLIGAGLYSFIVNAPKEQAFYTPGSVPKREDCFYTKLAQFKNVTKQIIFSAAQECELEIQSIEGHEQIRQEWIDRQAEKARQRAAQQPVAAPPPEEPKEKDTLRRVWR